jgi:hypothetical protein
MVPGAIVSLAEAGAWLSSAAIAVRALIKPHIAIATKIRFIYLSNGQEKIRQSGNR